LAGVSDLLATMGRRLVSCFSMLNQKGAPRVSRAALASTPGSWGGHDIPYLSYDGKWYRCVTWEKGLLLSYDWDAAYALEGFVVVTDEMLGSRGGTSPAGFKWDQLIHDCEHL